jgi:integrase
MSAASAVSRTRSGRFSEDYPPERRTLRFADWPAADRQAFARARDSGGPFDAPGRAAGWAAATVRRRVAVYGRYLNWLKRQGLLNEAEEPAARLTPDRLVTYLRDYRAMASPSSVLPALHALRQVMAALAPARDWSWITRSAARPTLREIRAAQRPRRVFDPTNLLRRALRLMEKLDAQAPTLFGSVWHRDALMTAIQCLFALRRRNLTGMRIGHNLILGETLMKIHFDPKETKTGRPIDGLIPEYLHRYVRSYLNRHRPYLLAGRVSDALWINRAQDDLEYSGTYDVFKRIGERLLGKPIRCHDFRYSVASAQLTRDPRKLLRTSGLLGHASVQSVNRFYDHSGDVGSRQVWNKMRRDLQRGR